MTQARMLNLQRVLARMGRLPQAMKEAVGDQLDTEAADLVAAQKRAAPFDPDSATPGAFRDSIRAYDNPDRPLSKRVIADARDPKGKVIAGNIEHGHRTPAGTHVAARPSFFPTYRARRKPMKRRIKAAARKALKQLYPKD